MFIYIGGVPAVGKSSMIQEVEKLASEQNINLKRTVGTDIMCELANVATVEELRRLPEETRRKLRPEMNRRIYEQDRLDPTTIKVCDGHFCFFDIKGEKYGTRQIQPWDRAQMKAFVVLLASPQTVLQRRIRDGIERPDRQRNLEFIEKEQQLEAQIATSQAQKLSIPIAFLVNGSKGSIVNKARLLLSLIQQWAKLPAGDGNFQVLIVDRHNEIRNF